MKTDAGIDLNCDLGEGEPWERTMALLDSVTSANVACGGHAGDAETVRAIAAETLRRGIRFGAHPGLPGGFGRDTAAVSPAELSAMLEEQLGFSGQIARQLGVGLRHVKLHGSLYHAANVDPALAEATLRVVSRRTSGAVLFAPPEGWLARTASGCGVEVWTEGFLDRGYRDDGTLVPRGAAGALLVGADAVRHRAREWIATGEVVGVTGRRLRMAPRTWCVHGDSPDAVAMAAAARVEFRRASADPSR